MNSKLPAHFNDKWILDKRGSKNKVDWYKPYGWEIEPERTLTGKIENTGTIFLTNKECPFHCLMCDLWKNTSDEPVPPGAIPAQIEWALERMPPVKHIKLYNSGSFFDGGAIPRKDYPKIAAHLKSFETVIVESHTKFIDERVLEFNEMLDAELQVAVGLETAHPKILPMLNKRMTLDDFRNGIDFLHRNKIQSRAFVLLSLPFLSPEESEEWAKKSIDFAFESGVECVIVIPLRTGNGSTDFLQEQGQLTLPSLKMLEDVLDYGINLTAGRVFADLWDLENFSTCNTCFDARKRRLNEINLTQSLQERIVCTCN
ncbi:radical SAM protein [uncultured Draconibacterium sp.]|uniref:radical SAM protein n=1 Tax=uncultured Draconibacterium sp. TaxID=1573823 RepID=UPI003216CD5E